MRKEYIKDFSGKILGYTQTKPNGDKTAHLFSGKIIAKYNKQMDWTTTFEGKVIARGDVCSSMILQEVSRTK